MTKKIEFKAKYNTVAANIMFNRALKRKDFVEAKEIAKICIKAQGEKK